MASLNIVLLMGNLTRDPELRYTPSGSAVCGLGIAVNRRYTARNGEQREEVCFVDVDVWDRAAENCQKFLRKGDPVFVEGRLRLDEWDDRDTGKRRSRLKVSAIRVQFLNSPTKGEFSDDSDGGDQGGDQGGGGYDRGSAPAPRGGGERGGYDRGGGGNDRGGGGGGGYDRGPSRPPRQSPPPRRDAAPPPPPFPADDTRRPANQPPPNNAFDVGDDEPVDDIPF